MSSFDEEWRALCTWYSEQQAMYEQDTAVEQEKYGLQRDSTANDRLQAVHQEFLKKRRELHAKYGKPEPSAAATKEVSKTYQTELYNILCQK